MQEIDINSLVNGNNLLKENIPNDIIIVGKIDNLYIDHIYDQLDLSRVECYKIIYHNQKGESIKNHILPDSLSELYCSENQLTSLPNLPNSLQEIYCSRNQLASLPKLPNSLERLSCGYNQLTSLPDLPNSLIKLYCHNNQLISLPELPNSLKELICSNNKLISLPKLPNSMNELHCPDNQLISLPELPNSMKELNCYNNLISLTNLNNLLVFRGNNIIEYINYNPDYEKTKIDFMPYLGINNIYLNGDNTYKFYKSIIEIKGYGKITSNEEYIKYMEYRSHKMNKIKSARK